MTLTLAVDHDGRVELAEAMAALAAEVRDGRRRASAIDEDALAAHLAAPDLPDPDLIVRTGGGGGWGDPLERDPHAVRADVVAELVSQEAARAQYGVVINHDLSLDSPATVRLRTEMRAGKDRSQPN